MLKMHMLFENNEKLNKDLGTTFLFSTHDEKVMGYLNRKIFLRDGIIEKDEKYIMKLELQLAFKNLFGARLRTF